MYIKRSRFFVEVPFWRVPFKGSSRSRSRRPFFSLICMITTRFRSYTMLGCRKCIIVYFGFD